MFTAIAVLTTAVVGAATFALAFKSIKGLQPAGKRLLRDLQLMEKTVRERHPELVPLLADELKLLSYNAALEERPRRKTPFRTGVLTNIYQEPLIAFAFKKYTRSAYVHLLYARTDRHEFYYRKSRKKGIEVAIDDQLIGFFDLKNHRLLKPDRQQAYLEGRPAPGNMITLFSGNKELASLNRNPEAGNPNPRVFTFVSPLTEKELTLLLAFAIYYVLQSGQHATKS